MKYSLIIPAYNEAPYIERTVRALAEACHKALSQPWEIIVVDNHSTDQTKEVVRQMRNPNVVVVEEPEGGKGRAWKAGTRAARGEVFAMTDADLSIEPAELVDKMVEFARGGVDVIIGTRLHPETKAKDREWWRIFTSRIFNFCINIVLPLSVSDSQCPFKVYGIKGKQILLLCREDTWYVDAEFLYRAKRSGMKILETPITWIEHRYVGRVTKVSLIDGPWTAIAAFRVRMQIFFET